MPSIKVDDEVFRVLQKKAEPLVDTPNTVIRRLLRLNGKRSRRAVASRVRGVGTPQQEFRVPILEALHALGGKATCRAVVRGVGQIVASKLVPADRETLSDGYTIRWENRVHWERLEMVNGGLLRSDSQRGVWEVTDEGRRYLHAQTRP